MIVPILIIFLGLIFLGLPIAFSMGATTSIMILANGWDLEMVVQKAFMGVNSFSLLALPLFILAGNIMGEGGLTRRLLKLADAIMGRLPGGMAITSIATCALFGTVSGSTVATTFAIGSVMAPELKKQNYDKGFIASILGPSGTLGMLIPPSITMVILGVTCNISIGKLFMAGFLPGILLATLMSAYAAFMAKKKGFGAVRTERTSLKEFILICADAFLPLMTPVIILGGIFTGTFTSTEAAAVAVVYGLLLALYYKELNWSRMSKILLDSTISSATILIIIAISNAFGWLLTVAKVPSMVAGFFLQYASTPLSFLLIVSAILLPLGMVMEVTSIIILLGPIFMPIALSYGIDPIHFGLVFMMNFVIANVTPPVGVSTLSGLSVTDPTLGLEDTMPYLLHIIGVIVISVLLIILFPQISLFLPNLFGVGNVG